MLLQKIVYVLLFTSIISFNAEATVGGPQYLTFLGIKDSNLYFIYEYLDEGVNPPELWQYDLTTSKFTIDKKWINFPHEAIEEALKRNNLFNLGYPDTLKIKNSIDFSFDKPRKEFSTSIKDYYNLYPLRIKWGNEAFVVNQCFTDKDNPTIEYSATLENFDISLAIIRYKGICFETGYAKDTLLIVKNSIIAAGSDVIDDGDIIIKEDKSKPLLLIIILVSVLLMAVILYRKIKK